MRMKFKSRLSLVFVLLAVAVIYSLKRRFFRPRTVILDQYLEDNRDRGHILDDELNAQVLDELDSQVNNCNSSSLDWTGHHYDLDDTQYGESTIIEQPKCAYFANITNVLFVYSNLSNTEQRDLIRSTFGNREARAYFKYKLLFVTGIGDGKGGNLKDQLNDVIVQREQMIYQDILQVQTKDFPENDSIKGVEALKWILKCVERVVNIIKVGDNTVPHLSLLFNYLNSRTYEIAHQELFCQLETGHMIEDKNKNITFLDSKTHQKVPIKIYPPFCRNSLILMSRFVAKQLLRVAETKPFFKLEDVYLTGLLRESACLPVPRKRMRSPKIVKSRPYNMGTYHFITFRKTNPDIFRKTWESSLILQKLVA